MKLIGEIKIHFVTKRTWRGENGACLIEAFIDALDGGERIFVGQISHPTKGAPWFFQPSTGEREKFTSCAKAWTRAFAYACETEAGKVHRQNLFGDKAA